MTSLGFKILHLHSRKERGREHEECKRLSQGSFEKECREGAAGARRALLFAHFSVATQFHVSPSRALLRY